MSGSPACNVIPQKRGVEESDWSVIIVFDRVISSLLPIQPILTED
jgi:hypothetical protein